MYNYIYIYILCIYLYPITIPSERGALYIWGFNRFGQCATGYIKNLSVRVGFGFE